MEKQLETTLWEGVLGKRKMLCEFICFFSWGCGGGGKGKGNGNYNLGWVDNGKGNGNFMGYTVFSGSRAFNKRQWNYRPS